jgi:predicted Zn-dependent peptidase
MTLDYDNIEQQIATRGSIKTLDNGIIIISENVPKSGLLTGQIFIDAGASHETPSDYGAMHFLEHVSLAGSRYYPDKDVRNLNAGVFGLDVNAFTSIDNIKYLVKGSGSLGYILQSNFLESFRMVYDAAFFPNITDEAVFRERSIIQRELAEFKHKKSLKPFGNINTLLDNKVYSNNILSKRDILGTNESINSITAKTLRDYHSKLFVGNNTVVRLIGDLDENCKILNDIEAMLSDVPKGDKAIAHSFVAEKPFLEKEVLNLTHPNCQNSFIELYYQIPPSDAIDTSAIHLASYLLGGSFNSLLFQNIREKEGLVYSIRSFLDGHSKTGFLRISYSVNPNYVDESLAIVDSSINQLKKGEFNSLLVDSFKASYLSNVLTSLQMPFWITNELTDRYLKNKSLRESTGLEQLKYGMNLTKQDAIEKANKYLGNDSLTVVVKQA